MRIDLKRISPNFPDWPSELDVAKGASNWAFLAQQFYCAAQVLREEADRVKEEIHEQDQQVEHTEWRLWRMNLGRPAAFCIAFSLELAVKAAYVSQHPDEIKDGSLGGLKGHSLIEKCKRISRFDFTDERMKYVKMAEEIILDGKYPVTLKPIAEITAPYYNANDVYYDSLIDMYHELMKIASTAPNPLA
ncbi:MAG: hypothetical protein HZC25_06195 [Rhodospirillales bacterium]|nr:hypothetical protein [Rhodospirillales bacterium]